MSAIAAQSSPFDRAAQPMLAMIDDLDLHAGQGAARLIDKARQLLDRFEAEALRAGAPGAATRPARYALAVLLDQRARALPQIELETWSVLTRRRLFDGRDMSLVQIRKFRDSAAARPKDFADLERFLSDLIAQAEAGRHAHRRPEGRGGWGRKIAGFILALALGLALYAGFLELRFHQRITAGFEAEARAIGLDQPREGEDLVQRLDQMRAAMDRVAAAAARAPLRRRIRLPVYDSQTHAEARYAQAVQSQAPGAVAGGIETVLATEGDGLILYDALRAWAVLTGRDESSPGYLAGWLEDNGARAGIDGLHRHADRLGGPYPDIMTQDAELRAQARGFAAETTEPDRAWLELLRDQQTRALPGWQPEIRVPDLSRVLFRRSGLPLDTPLPGIFTQLGWDHARDYGVGVAVRKARAIAPLVPGLSLPSENRSPDLLMDRLLDQTIATWDDWLADLRVQPFTQRDTAILVSGLLARPDNPLTHLLREVWVQVGGRDRRRGHEQQLRLAREFGPMIQYVEQGRISEISTLFASLNVALGAMERDQGRGMDRLMSIHDKTRSIAALQSAPRIVVQIAEDVLAQSASRQSALADGGNPLIRQWRQEVFPLCLQTVQDRYPFAKGRDADVGQVTALLGPQGALSLFLHHNVLPLMETGESPWRWKPDARFEGLDPDSAQFFERAAQLSEGLFADNGSIDHLLTLSALAERGQTLFVIGGEARPVRATGEPVQMRWPGAAPAAGIEISFREGTDAERLIYPGEWGLLHMLDTLRLRLRDQGARVLLDLRGDFGRVFLEMAFTDSLNPVSVRSAMAGFTCPPNL